MGDKPELFILIKFYTRKEPTCFLISHFTTDCTEKWRKSGSNNFKKLFYFLMQNFVNIYTCTKYAADTNPPPTNYNKCQKLTNFTDIPHLPK